MPAPATAPSLMDDAEFLAELETLEPRKPDRPRERLDDRQRWESHLRHRAVFEELKQASADGPAPAGRSVVITMLVTLMCALAGAGAAAFVFHERLAQILR